MYYGNAVPTSKSKGFTIYGRQETLTKRIIKDAFYRDENFTDSSNSISFHDYTNRHIILNINYSPKFETKLIDQEVNSERLESIRETKRRFEELGTSTFEDLIELIVSEYEKNARLTDKFSLELACSGVKRHSRFNLNSTPGSKINFSTWFNCKNRKKLNSQDYNKIQRMLEACGADLFDGHWQVLKKIYQWGNMPHKLVPLYSFQVKPKEEKEENFVQKLFRIIK